MQSWAHKLKPSHIKLAVCAPTNHSCRASWRVLRRRLRALHRWGNAGRRQAGLSDGGNNLPHVCLPRTAGNEAAAGSLLHLQHGSLHSCLACRAPRTQLACEVKGMAAQNAEQCSTRVHRYPAVSWMPYPLPYTCCARCQDYRVCVENQGRVLHVTGRRSRKIGGTRAYTAVWKCGDGWHATQRIQPAGNLQASRVPQRGPQLALQASGHSPQAALAPPAPALPLASAIRLLPFTRRICIIARPSAGSVWCAAAGGRRCAVRVQRAQQVGGQVGHGHILFQPRIHGLHSNCVGSCKAGADGGGW